MKKRKVLILGGGGFIGFAIAKILALRENYDITIGDNFHLDQDDNEFYKCIYDITKDPLILKDFISITLKKIDFRYLYIIKLKYNYSWEKIIMSNYQIK